MAYCPARHRSRHDTFSGLTITNTVPG